MVPLIIFDLGHLWSNSDFHDFHVSALRRVLDPVGPHSCDCTLTLRLRTECNAAPERRTREHWEHDTQITQWLTWHDMDWNMDWNGAFWLTNWLYLIVMGAIWSRVCIAYNTWVWSQGQAEQAAESPSFDAGATALDKIWHTAAAHVETSQRQRRNDAADWFLQGNDLIYMIVIDCSWLSWLRCSNHSQYLRKWPFGSTA